MWSLVFVIALPCWPPPLDAPVIDPFRLPACTWCPGNRGIEYGPTPGQSVRAVEPGTVTFVGTVASTRYVVIEHRDGLRATYGRMASSSVRRGEEVDAGDMLGTTSDRFYFGLRDGDRPVDPTPRLGERIFPTRLVPIDGSAPRAAGRGRLRCGTSGAHQSDRTYGSQNDA